MAYGMVQGWLASVAVILLADFVQFGHRQESVFKDMAAGRDTSEYGQRYRLAGHRPRALGRRPQVLAALPRRRHDPLRWRLCASLQVSAAKIPAEAPRFRFIVMTGGGAT